MDKIARMKELIALIEKYNYAYYTLDNPLISDKEYDDLYYELVGLEKTTGTVLDNSPTKKVGDVVLDKFKKVKHVSKLYSLNKANSYEELKDWYKKSNLPLKRFFNTSGLLYKSMGLKDKLPTMSEDEQLKLLATDGMLVKRPIIVSDNVIMTGFKEKEWEENLK